GAYLYAKPSTESCKNENSICVNKCKELHSTPKYDVYGKKRKETKITKQNRNRCLNVCKQNLQLCKRRMKIQQKNEEINTQDNSYLPSENSIKHSGKIYQWTDFNNKKHFTNDYESIPSKYKKQIKK
ncbi:MAG: hypothetical protein V3U58_00715, partial [Thermodesulfobacteriota bacterium]